MKVSKSTYISGSPSTHIANSECTTSHIFDGQFVIAGLRRRLVVYESGVWITLVPSFRDRQLPFRCPPDPELQRFGLRE
jgi:hypothetical protein